MVWVPRKWTRTPLTHPRSSSGRRWFRGRSERSLPGPAHHWGPSDLGVAVPTPLCYAGWFSFHLRLFLLFEKHVDTKTRDSAVKAQATDFQVTSRPQA